MTEWKWIFEGGGGGLKCLTIYIVIWYMFFLNILYKVDDYIDWRMH